jgi:hypothetical protein
MKQARSEKIQLQLPENLQETTARLLTYSCCICSSDPQCCRLVADSLKKLFALTRKYLSEQSLAAIQRCAQKHLCDSQVAAITMQFKFRAT